MPDGVFEFGNDRIFCLLHHDPLGGLPDIARIECTTMTNAAYARVKLDPRRNTGWTFSEGGRLGGASSLVPRIAGARRASASPLMRASTLLWPRVCLTLPAEQPRGPVWEPRGILECNLSSLRGRRPASAGRPQNCCSIADSV